MNYEKYNYISRHDSRYKTQKKRYNAMRKLKKESKKKEYNERLKQSNSDNIENHKLQYEYELQYLKERKISCFGMKPEQVHERYLIIKEEEYLKHNCDYDFEEQYYDEEEDDYDDYDDYEEEENDDEDDDNKSI